jgi:HD-GYP domain-containing protein (c-di-GMP phosphodiesterase class II)
VAALSAALDITEGQPEGHAARSCLIGIRIAELAGVPSSQHAALFYALLLKDLGCSSNAARVSQLFGADDLPAKRDMKVTDWSSLPQAAVYALRNTAPGAPLSKKAIRLAGMALAGGPLAARSLFAVRCERGAQIATELSLPRATASAIHDLDEHWDGRGYPLGLRGDQIDPLARILCLAQTVEIFHASYGLDAARAVAVARRGSWFDPALVDVLGPLWADAAFWQRLAAGDPRAAVAAVSPADTVLGADDQMLDQIAAAFAQVIDAKSPWTYQHSAGVAEKSTGIGELLGLAPSELRDLRQAALLHDIGKLGVSNAILDKPGSLNEAELAAMRQHPIYSRRILERVSSFQTIAHIASLHHERLDGRGYPYGLSGPEIPRLARILAVADFCDALRAAMPWPEAYALMKRNVGTAICADSFDALCAHMDRAERDAGLREAA